MFIFILIYTALDPDLFKDNTNVLDHQHHENVNHVKDTVSLLISSFNRTSVFRIVISQVCLHRSAELPKQED